MSKTLALIRHAKSTWEYGPISDLDRPLKEIGISNTFIVSQKIKEHGITPDLIISSPAIRALHTALIVARELRYPAEKIHIDQELYSESEDDILEMVKSVNNNINNLFIFGHNPGFTFLSNRFLKNRIDNLPTSGVALIEFNVTHWSEISPKTVESDICFFAKK